jgi:hypothetical protein
MEYFAARRTPTTMKTVFLGLASLAFGAMPSFAAEARFESGPQKTALIELYTSEGCSSCPPAEAWMSRLKDNPGLWKRFVPIAFHVDYWDRLGWRDRFSSKRWTERQGRYASLWQSGSVYTPALVVNGSETRNWLESDPSRVNDKNSGVLNVSTVDGKTFAIDFKPENRNTGDWDAHLALLGSGISSNVRAGENRGRNLQHDFVVLDLRDAAMKPENGTLRAHLTIEATGETGPRKAVAVWVSMRDRLAPVQATGGWLP